MSKTLFGAPRLRPSIAIGTLLLILMAMPRTACAQSWSVSTQNALLQVSYGQGSQWPVYAAFHLDSSYYRLNPGPGAGWGTSLILQPCYWSGGNYFQGGPITPVSSRTDTQGNLILTFQGTVGALSTTSTVTLSPPASGQIQARTQVRVFGSAPLDGNRPGEAFKPVALSSMHVSAALWDSQEVVTDGGQRTPYPSETGWILFRTVSSILALPGGTSQWKTNAPTIEIVLDRARPVSGWHTQDTNPNDDNILVWAASDTILSSWEYRVTARFPGPASRTVSGTVHLQDCLLPEQPLNFEFRPTDGSASLSRTLTLSPDGSFRIENIPARSYDLAIKGSRWLQSVLHVDAAGGDVSGLTVTLQGGDANNDNSVDALDLALLIEAFNTVQGSDAGYNAAADLNGDTSVDALDLALLITNFNTAGDP